MSCAVLFVDEPQAHPISNSGMLASVANGNHLSVVDVGTLTELHHRRLLENDYDCLMCEWNGMLHVLTLV